MGRAEIISGGTDGLYKVRLDYGTETRDKRVEKLTADLATVQGQLDTAESELADQQAIVSSQQAALNSKISEYETAAQSLDALRLALDDAIQDRLGLSENATPEEIAAANAAVAEATAAYNAAEAVLKNADKEINAALKKLEEEKAKVYPLQLKVDLLIDEKTKLSKLKKYWTDLTLQEEKNVWCADMTEDATGNVATLEIPGENNLVVIKPGAPAPVAADGKLVARAIQDPNQVFFNAAVLPGWQKYKPTFRRGTITELDIELDTASVTLTDDKSSAQNLGINKVSELKNVPVKYMECNASAFEVGDTVVVQFDDQSWDKPKITGFVREPKSCTPDAILTMHESEWGAFHYIYSFSQKKLIRKIRDTENNTKRYPHGVIGKVNLLITANIDETTAGINKRIRVNASTYLDIDTEIVAPSFDYKKKFIACIDHAAQTNIILMDADYKETSRSTVWGSGYAYLTSALNGNIAIGGYDNNDYRIKVINAKDFESVSSFAVVDGGYYLSDISLTEEFIAAVLLDEAGSYLRLYDPLNGSMLAQAFLGEGSDWTCVTASKNGIAVIKEPITRNSTQVLNGVPGGELLRIYTYSKNESGVKELVLYDEITDMFTDDIYSVAQIIGPSLERFVIFTAMAGR